MRSHDILTYDMDFLIKYYIHYMATSCHCFCWKSIINSNKISELCASHFSFGVYLSTLVRFHYITITSLYNLIHIWSHSTTLRKLIRLYPKDFFILLNLSLKWKIGYRFKHLVHLPAIIKLLSTLHFRCFP